MEQPTYYAIIPANVRYDSRLTADEKLLYGEITCLSNAKGYCYASNAYFAELYRVDVRTVQRWLKNLSKCGYINVSYTRDSRESCLRKIYINANYVNPSPDTSGIDGETEAEPEPARAEYVENPNINKSYAKAIFDKWSGYGLPNRGEIEFLSRFGSCHTYLKGISSDDVLKAIDNYASVRARPDSWYAKKHNLTFESFCRCIDRFLDGNFDLVNFCDSAAEEKPKEEPNYMDCPKCHKKQAERMTNIAPVYYHCHNCNQDSSESDVYDYADCIRFGTTDINVMRKKRAELQAEIEREEEERKREEAEENAKWLARYREITGSSSLLHGDEGAREAPKEKEKEEAKDETKEPEYDSLSADDKEKELRRLGEEALRGLLK